MGHVAQLQTIIENCYALWDNVKYTFPLGWFPSYPTIFPHPSKVNILYSVTGCRLYLSITLHYGTLCTPNADNIWKLHALWDWLNTGWFPPFLPSILPHFVSSDRKQTIPAYHFALWDITYPHPNDSYILCGLRASVLALPYRAADYSPFDLRDLCWFLSASGGTLCTYLSYVRRHKWFMWHNQMREL